MDFPTVLAFLGPDQLAIMIPITALIIPIVAILTKHQQKMAEIIHSGGNIVEVQELRREVADLRAMVQRQSYALDQLNGLTAGSKLQEQDLSMRLQQ